MSDIEIFIFVLFVALFLFDWCIYYTIIQLEKNIYDLKLKRDAQDCVQMK